MDYATNVWSFSDKEIVERRDQLLAEANNSDDRTAYLISFLTDADSKECMLNKLALMSAGLIQTWGDKIEAGTHLRDWDTQHWYLTIDYDVRSDWYVIHVEMDKVTGKVKVVYNAYHK